MGEEDSAYDKEGARKKCHGTKICRESYSESCMARWSYNCIWLINEQTMQSI